MMKALATLIFKLIGWTPQPYEDVPDKCVIIGYPHTSNWDLVMLELAALHYGQHLNWLGKTQIFAPGVGWMMRAIGGIPVDRSAPQGLVKQVAQEIRSAKGKVRLVIPPEGTRSRVEYWKSGFYYIALEAGIPIQAARVNYRTKVIGFGQRVDLTGDVKADMDRIRAALEGNEGRRPELASPVPPARREWQPSATRKALVSNCGTGVKHSLGRFRGLATFRAVVAVVCTGIVPE